MKTAQVHVSLLEPKFLVVFKMDVSIHQKLRSCYRANHSSQRQVLLIIALCSESGFRSKRFNGEMKDLGPFPWRHHLNSLILEEPDMCRNSEDGEDVSSRLLKWL